MCFRVNLRAKQSIMSRIVDTGVLTSYLTFSTPFSIYAYIFFFLWIFNFSSQLVFIPFGIYVEFNWI